MASREIGSSAPSTFLSLGTRSARRKVTYGRELSFRSGLHLGSRFWFLYRLVIWAATTVAATGFGWIGCAGEALGFSNKIGAHFRKSHLLVKKKNAGWR